MSYGTVIYRDAFDLTNADLITIGDVPWITTKNTPTTIDILGSACRMKTTGTPATGYADFAEAKVLVRAENFEAQVDFQFVSNIEQYANLSVRRSVTDNAAQLNSPNDGLYIECDGLGNNIQHLISAAGGVQSGIGTSTLAVANGIWYTMKIRCVGSSIYWKTYPVGSETPGWTAVVVQHRVNYLDNREYVSFGILGGAAAGADALFKNFKVTRFYEGDPSGILDTPIVATGTAYTDNVTTTIVCDTSATTDSRGMFESQTTTAVGVTSATDVGAFNETPTTTAVGVTSETDVAAFIDTPTTTAVVLTGELDSVAMLESVTTTGVVTTSDVDVFGMVESVVTTAVGITSAVDSAGYTETPTTTVTVVTSETDVGVLSESVLTTVTVLTGESDLLAMYETPTTIGVVVINSVDQLAMTESVATVAVVVSSEVDQAAFNDVLGTTIVVVTSEEDSLNGTPVVGPSRVYFGSMILNI